MAPTIPKKNSGGIPGFRYMSELADLVTTRLTSQANAVNTAWDKILSPDAYEIRDWTRDIAKAWVSGFQTVEDLLTFPMRYQQQDRPPWISLAWDRTTKPDSAQGEVTLPNRQETTVGVPAATSLERLGPDQGDNIDPKDVSVSLDGTGVRLSIAIKNLGAAPKAKNVGHFVGFVTMPNAAQPIAIVFLTIT